MDIKYILIQLIGFIGTALFLISYQFKENKTLFRFQFASYIFYTVHFILLGALTGGLSYIINALRSFCLSTKNKFLNSYWMCLILCLLQAAVLPFTWSGWICILPVVANIVATVGGYSHNARTIRIIAMFVNSPLWIVYDIMVGSWAGIIDESVTEISAIISIIRFGWKNLDQTEK